MEFKVSNNGNATILSIGFAPTDGFVNGEAMYLSNTPIKGILGSSVQGTQMQFVCMNGISLGERLKQPMSKVQYLLLMQQFAAITRDLKALNLSVDKLLLDFRYIFINETTWELQMAYTPCAAKANANNIIGFLSAISAMTKPFREADMEYAKRFAAYLKSTNAFEYNLIEDYILKEDAKVVEAVNKSHPPKKVAPVVTPEPVIKEVNVNQVPQIGIADMMEDNLFEEEKAQPTPIPKPIVPAAQPTSFDEDELEATSLLVEGDKEIPEPVKPVSEAEDEFVYRPATTSAPQPVASVQPAPVPVSIDEEENTALLIEDEPVAPTPIPVAPVAPHPVQVPQPAVRPAPQPVAQPTPAPQPVAKPVPQPVPQPAARPVPKVTQASPSALKPAYELTSSEVNMAKMAPAPQPAVRPAPQPVAQPTPAPQPVAKQAPQPVAQPVPAPQPVAKPVTQPVAQPVPAPQPVAQPTPVPQPVAKPAPQPVAANNFYEDNTALLADEPFAPMDTYNNGPAPAKEYIKYPSLKRIFNGDVVKVTKPVFRIGKERSYVDYFVSNSNVISRSHADIIIRDNRYFITDLNSKNKTYINGRMIMPNCEVEIFDGDTITLANEDFLFKV